MIASQILAVAFIKAGFLPANTKTAQMAFLPGQAATLQYQVVGQDGVIANLASLVTPQMLELLGRMVAQPNYDFTMVMNHGAFKDSDETVQWVLEQVAQKRSTLNLGELALPIVVAFKKQVKQVLYYDGELVLDQITVDLRTLEPKYSFKPNPEGSSHE